MLRVGLNYSSSNDLTVFNRFYLKYSGSAPDGTALNSFAAGVSAAWAAHIAGLCTANVTLLSVDVTDLSSSTAAEGSATAGHPGSNASTELPASLATLLNFQVARRYRGGKPRLYLPAGGNVDLLNGQQWVSSWPPTVLAAWSAFISTLSSPGPGGATITGPVNVSYYEGFKPFETPSGRYKNIAQLRPGGPLVEPITGVTVNQRVATQRRRVSSS